MRDPSDSLYKDGLLEVNDEIEVLVGEIKMMLFTNRGEVLGAPDFGVNLEEMLFTLSLNEYAIKQSLAVHVMKFCPLAEKYGVTFDVKFSRGSVRDICLIDINILGEPLFGVLVS